MSRARNPSPTCIGQSWRIPRCLLSHCCGPGFLLLSAKGGGAVLLCTRSALAPEPGAPLSPGNMPPSRPGPRCLNLNLVLVVCPALMWPFPPRLRLEKAVDAPGGPSANRPWCQTAHMASPWAPSPWASSQRLGHPGRPRVCQLQPWNAELGPRPTESYPTIRSGMREGHHLPPTLFSRPGVVHTL